MHLTNWQQFGLKKNPYDTLPLVEGGNIPIEKAFIGREREKQFIDDLFESNNRLCLTICGDVGIGKTSLANFQKFIWKSRTQKLLFSFRREIEVSHELLNKKNFLIEVIGSVLREIKLLEPKLLEKELLKKLNYIVDVSQTTALSGGISFAEYGIEAGKEKSIDAPIQLSMAILEGYYRDLIEFIKEHEINGHPYSGLIIHVNNFDVILKTAEGRKIVIAFFDEMRDFLQISDTYFLFLGPRTFFKDVICPSQRVKSIFFQTPLIVDPLSKAEIIRAFEERMYLLKSEDVMDFIKPIKDEVVYQLYELYNGDIRSIMSSIVDIMSQYSEKLAKPLGINEALSLLGRERWDRIETGIGLSEKQKELLQYLASLPGNFSQKDVAKETGIAQTNLSSYYFNPLKENDIIEEKEKDGRIVYYGLTDDYIPLRWLIQLQKNIKKSAMDKSKQLNLL